MTRRNRILELTPLALLAALGVALYPDRPKAKRIAPDRVGKVSWEGATWLRIDARANEYAASTQDEPSVVFTADGDALVAWQSRRQQDGSNGVYTRRMAPNGELVGGEAALAWRRADQSEPALAACERFAWAAWQSRSQLLDQTGLFLRRLDNAATIRIPSTQRGEHDAVSLAARPGGGVLAAWLTTTTSGKIAHVQAFDASGHPVAPARALGAATAVSLATHTSRSLVVWKHPERGLLGQRVDAGGGTVASATRIDDARGQAIEPAVAADAGGFAVVWMEIETGGQRYEVRHRRIAEDGAPGRRSTVVSEDATWNSGATVACLGDGRSVVAWNAEEIETDASVVRMRTVAPDGQLSASFAIGNGRLRVADGRNGIAIGRDGRIAIAWAGDAGLGDESGVHLSVLVPRRTNTAIADAKPPRAGVTQERIDEATFETVQLDVRFKSEAAVPHDPPFEVASDGKPSEPSPPELQATGDFGFTAFNTGFVKLTPPDPHLGVGPEHIVSACNSGIGIWKKDGTRTFLQSIYRANNFWSSVGGNGFNFDPEVHWDPHAKRFVAMCCERNGSNSYFLLAISDDADPNGVWHKYRVNVTPQAGSGIDSPNLGIDDQAIYLTADMYGNQRQYAIYIMEKKPLLDGKAPGITRALRQSRFSGGVPVMWGTSPGRAMYMIHDWSSTSIRLSAIRNPLTTPSIVTTFLTVPSYSRPASMTQRGTTGRITTFNARFWSCMWRNGSLWACHHQGSPVKSRWYEIKTNAWPLTGQPTLVQSGDVQAGPGKHATFNAITVDDAGNALMTFASSSASDYISIARCWRAASDPLGTMRPAVLVKTNTSAYASSRWGDYSDAAADPSAPNTVWYTHEIATARTTWNTWIARKKTAILATDVESISSSTGGTVQFFLDNPARANRTYLILGTGSGTTPGFRIGSLQVPINLDAFTTGALGLVNSGAFPGFFGSLDANGCATASMRLPALPGFTGTLHFAFVQDLGNYVYASPATRVDIVR